jgi:hypothetical protein
MRLPRVRFTVRRMMVAVAIVAVSMPMVRTARHSWECWTKAQKFAAINARLRDFRPGLCGAVKWTAERERASATFIAGGRAYYARMEAKYRRAAWRPWESVLPDERHPWF